MFKLLPQRHLLPIRSQFGSIVSTNSYLRTPFFETAQFSRNLFQPRCLAAFAKSPLKSPNPQVSQQSQTQTVEDVVDFLQKKEDTAIYNYGYSNKFIYTIAKEEENTQNKFKVTINTFRALAVAQAALWSPVFYSAYQNANSQLASIACLGAMITGLSSWFGYRLVRDSVMRLELVNNHQVKVYSWIAPEQGTLFNIEGAKFKRVQNIFGVDPKDRTKDYKPPENITIEVEMVRAGDGKKQRLVFVMSLNSVTVQNLNLFRCILHGNTAEIPKFKLQTSPLSATKSK